VVFVARNARHKHHIDPLTTAIPRDPINHFSSFLVFLDKIKNHPILSKTGEKKRNMSLKRLLNLKGINLWYLASAVALNLFWTISMALIISMLFLKQYQGGASTVQLLLMVATFLGPFLIGWIVGAMAADGRGPTYGVYGSLGSIVVLVIVALPTGLLGIMLIVAAFSGGFNGGLFSIRQR
jgi:hypothetical protein